MNRFAIFALCAVALLSFLTPGQSQAPASASAQQRLQELKTKNAQLQQQQEATLQKLEELSKEAQQLRILARRT